MIETTFFILFWVLLISIVTAIILVATKRTNKLAREETPVSQDTMVHIYNGILQKAPIYEKFGVVQAVKLLEPTIVHTYTSSGHETTCEGKPEEWVITNPMGEKYVISNKTLESKYKHLVGDDYIPIGKVKAFEYKGASTSFIAIWGEPMQLNDGDMLCTPCPTTDPISEVYRIDRKEFFETYRRT